MVESTLFAAMRTLPGAVQAIHRERKGVIPINAVLRASEMRATTPTAGFSEPEGERNISNSTFPQDF